DAEPAVPRKVLQLHGSQEHARGEPGLIVVADVLDALRIAVVDCLVPERVTERDPLAAARHERYQAALQIHPLGPARVVASYGGGERPPDGVSRAGFGDGARRRGVGVNPPFLQPGGPHPPVEARRLVAQDLTERAPLERRVPVAVARTQAPP